MSVFPTKVLLATNGSEVAELALRTAVDLSNNTDSELHASPLLVQSTVLGTTFRRPMVRGGERSRKESTSRRRRR